MTVHATSTREYDLFGPWVDVVSDTEDIPRLFNPAGVDPFSARLVIKVPRDIARRDATPDMDLYDHLAVLDDAAVTVHSRHKGKRPGPRGGFSTTRIPLSEVLAVRTTVDLLAGSFEIFTASQRPVRIEFNGASHNHVDLLAAKLMGALEEPLSDRHLAALSAVRAGREPSIETPDLQQDLALVAALAETRRHASDLSAVAWHPRATAHRRRGGAMGLTAALRDALAPVTLHGGILATTADTVDFMTRRTSLTRRSHPEHSTSHLRIPERAIDTLVAEPHPRYEGVSLIGFGSTQSLAVVAVPADSALPMLISALSGH